MFFCPFLWLETHKWNKTPSLRLGSPQPASSTGLKTMGSNLHHLTKKRHQNLKTISCLRLLKIRLLRHSCRTVNLMMRPHGILKNQLQPNAVKDTNRFHRPPISFSITRIYSQPGDPQTNSSSTKDFVAALGTELHGTMELKKETKMQETISSVKLASERLVNSSVLCFFQSYSLVSLPSFYDWGRFSLSKDKIKMESITHWGQYCVLPFQN